MVYTKIQMPSMKKKKLKITIHSFGVVRPGPMQSAWRCDTFDKRLMCQRPITVEIEYFGFHASIAAIFSYQTSRRSAIVIVGWIYFYNVYTDVFENGLDVVYGAVCSKHFNHYPLHLCSPHRIHFWSDYMYKKTLWIYWNNFAEIGWSFAAWICIVSL